MSSKLQKVENNVAELELVVEAAKFDAALEKSYRKNVKSITLPGFRKGKAPRRMIERAYGKTVFYEDAINFVLQDEYEAAIEEHKLDPVDYPNVEVKEAEEGKDLAIDIKVTVKPDPELGEYKGVKVAEIHNDVTDADVDRELEQRQHRNSRMITVEDRSAQQGDTVNIDFEGFADGVAFPGGKGEGYSLELGSGQFIPGFEEQIAGKSIGEEFEVNVTFPKDYHAEDLKGKAAVFKTKLNSIQYRELPELDDEFAKDVSEFDTLDELRADIKAKLEKAAEDKTKSEKQNAVMDKIMENVKVDIPDCMVQKRVDSIVRENEMRMGQQGLTFEQYLGYIGSNLEQFREQMKPNAERQVKGTLVLEKIAGLENMEVSEDELNSELTKMAESYGMDLEKIRSILRPEDIDSIRDDVRMTKTLDMLVESAVWTAEKPAAKKPAAKKSTTKKAADKDSDAKKETAKKETAKKATTKKAAADKEPAKKTTTKKSTAKKAADKEE